MKISFDIKYRPQIESGEYKVIYLSYELEEESPARIICWDRHNKHPIVALISNSGGYERVTVFQEEGIDNNNPHQGTLLIVTPEEELTEFEKGLINFYNKRNEIVTDKDGMYNRHDCTELLHESAKTLLALAKEEFERRDEVITLDNLPPYDKGFQDGKTEAMADLERTFECNQDKLPEWLKNELAKKHLEGYTLGKEDTMRDMSDFLKSHFKDEETKGYNPPAINVPTWTPPCFNGGPCTNPHKDCINCPRSNIVISPNTASGTSTLKAE